MKILAFIFICLISFEVKADNDFTALIDVAYAGDQSGEQQKLDIYVPKQLKKAMPVHMYVHGGAWTKGDKSLKRLEVKSYTDNGIILVSINYRLGPDHKYPDNVRDVLQASKWLRNNISKYGGDPNNIVISGHSAGAHLVALVGVGTPDAKSLPSSRLFRAIFSIDTASYDLTEPSKGRFSRFVNKQKLATFGDRKAILRRASPLHQINPNVQYAPFHLYVTSTRPDAVKGTQDLEKALQSSNHKVDAHILKGGLSHSDMRDEIFNSSSLIFKSIVHVFNDHP